MITFEFSKPKEAKKFRSSFQKIKALEGYARKNHVIPIAKGDSNTKGLDLRTNHPKEGGDDMCTPNLNYARTLSHTSPIRECM